MASWKLNVKTSKSDFCLSVEIVSDESTTHQKFPTPMLTAQASAVTCLLAPIPTQRMRPPTPRCDLQPATEQAVTPHHRHEDTVVTNAVRA